MGGADGTPGATQVDDEDEGEGEGRHGSGEANDGMAAGGLKGS
jgi:hypothetical protein